MFSLIITIISIALVAALALATIYYGGTAFNKGSAEAKASQLINEGQQINGAVAMARADVAADSNLTLPTDIAGLVTAEYLAQVPAGWDSADELTQGFAVTTNAVSTEVCDAVNSKAGLTGAVTTATVSAYGCVAADAAASVSGDARTVFYKF